MIEDSVASPNKKWDNTFKLDSEIGESDVDGKNLNERASTTDGQPSNDRRISFEEVISTNLSNIYQNICKDPIKITTNNRIHFQDAIQNNEQILGDDNGKGFLPVDSNLELEINQRPASRKPSLKGYKGEKGKTGGASNEKFEEKEKSQIGAATEKHVRIQSENVIKYFPEDEKQQTQPEQRNQQTSFQNAERLLTDLSREFQYVGDFSLIRKEVAELAISKSLTIMQNTSEFVTIKASSKTDYCQCLIKSCLNLEESGGIFQLKNCIYKRNKAKFILISGNQTSFLKFFRTILIRLWNLKSLKLPKKQLVEFFVNAQKVDPSMKELKKQYTKLYNSFSGLTDETKSSVKSTSQSLITSLKDNFNRLRSSEKRSSKNIGDRFMKVLDYNEKVNSKFIELRRKLFSLEQPYDSDLEKELQTEIYFHQFPVWKLFGFFYKTEFQSFISKRDEIVTNYSLRRIFLFLQIQEQYSLFLIQKGRLNLKNEVQGEREKVKSCQTFEKGQNQPGTLPTPYQECIRMIESMNSCSLIPSKFLEKVEQFYKQLQTSYNQLYTQKTVVKTSSMDDELPVTIFILLMAEMNESKSVSLNILGKIKWLLKWIEHQENNKEVQFDSSKPSNQVQQSFALHKKILTTFQAALVFVVRDWKDHEAEGQKDPDEEANENQQNE